MQLDFHARLDVGVFGHDRERTVKAAAAADEQRGEQLRDMFCMLLTQGWGVAEVLTLTDVTHKEFENYTKIASALEDDEDNTAITSTPHLASVTKTAAIHLRFRLQKH